LRREWEAARDKGSVEHRVEALWPYLWHDTLDRIEWWVNFHRHHEYYNIEFLGRNYFSPPSPRSYVPVMIAATGTPAASSTTPSAVAAALHEPQSPTPVMTTRRVIPWVNAYLPPFAFFSM